MVSSIILDATNENLIVLSITKIIVKLIITRSKQESLVKLKWLDQIKECCQVDSLPITLVVFISELIGSYLIPKSYAFVATCFDFYCSKSIPMIKLHTSFSKI